MEKYGANIIAGYIAIILFRLFVLRLISSYNINIIIDQQGTRI